MSETLRLLAADWPRRAADRAGRGIRQGQGAVARPRATRPRTPSTSNWTSPRLSRRSPARSDRRTGSCSRKRRTPSPRPCPPTPTTQLATADLRHRGSRGDHRPRRGRDRGDHLLHEHLQPSVMIGGGLVAKKAVERGLTRKPWVKTTLAPGSQVVTDYYDKAGLTPYLDKLGFDLVGYGCTTCIGNSGPLPAEVSAAVNEADLAVTSVLSGNRNFEGRINPDVKMNYLASPPLVVAYALAGAHGRRHLLNEPLGVDADGKPVFLATFGRVRRRLSRPIAAAIDARDVRASIRRCLRRRRALAERCRPRRATPSRGMPDSTYVRKPPYFEDMGTRAAAGHRHPGAPECWHKLGDSVTTDHISPAGCDQGRQPGRPVPQRARRRPAGLQLLRVSARQSRGDDSRHVREHPPAQPAARWRRGRLHASTFSTAQMRRSPAIYDAAQTLPAAGIPLVVLAGKEYGSGSSRDWAAKGTAAARRASRHRRVLRAHPPLEPDWHGRAAPAVPRRAERRESLGLTGDETFDIAGVTELNDGRTPGNGGGHGDRSRRLASHASMRSCGSTLPVRPTTTATAASCSTSCGHCCPDQGPRARQCHERVEPNRLQ